MNKNFLSLERFSKLEFPFVFIVTLKEVGSSAFKIPLCIFLDLTIAVVHILGSKLQKKCNSPYLYRTGSCKLEEYVSNADHFSLSVSSSFFASSSFLILAVLFFPWYHRAISFQYSLHWTVQITKLMTYELLTTVTLLLLQVRISSGRAKLFAINFAKTASARLPRSISEIKKKK